MADCRKLLAVNRVVTVVNTAGVCHYFITSLEVVFFRKARLVHSSRALKVLPMFDNR